MSEAERIAGLERHALAVDWFVDETPSPVRSVTIAATARQHLEARIECAAIAGISLTAIDGEPHAALRAMRYAASYELDPHEPYARCGSVRTACTAGGSSTTRICRRNALSRRRNTPISPMRCAIWPTARELDCALLSGEVDLLDGVGFSSADIADVLGCTVLPFECAALGGLVAAVRRFAVARAGRRGRVRACVARGARMMRGLFARSGPNTPSAGHAARVSLGRGSAASICCLTGNATRGSRGRRRVLEWIAARLAGCAAVLALAAWQAFDRARLDAHRASIEQSLTQLARRSRSTRSCCTRKTSSAATRHAQRACPSRSRIYATCSTH